MAGKKENLKALFTNTRTRVIIVFTVIIMLLVVIIGLIKFNSSINPDKSKTNLGNSPNISSIPGAVSQTAQYASLQETQNIEQAEKANKSGGSAIPTIIRTHKFGEGVEVVGPQQGTGGKGFETLAREDNSGTQQSLWLQSVKENSCSKASVANAINQGASLNEFKDACSCAQLKDNGYKLNELNKFCPCRELKAAGFNARELKEAGYTAEKLRQCGFDACELRGAEFTAQQMKDGGYSDGELKGSGFSDKDIARASGLPDGISSADVLNSGCKSDALGRLRTAGVTASAIRRISGCSAAQLKAAGFTVGDLKTAGFSAAELKNAGFSPANIKEAGYNARDLLNAGFTPDEVANAGFSADELKEAQEILPPGMTIDDIKAAGCDEQAIKRQRLAGVSAKLINKYSGCTAESLKNAGFSNNEIDGIKQMAAADQLGSSAESDKDAAVIKAAGCDVDSLKQLLIKGISAKRIHDLNGCSAEALKSAGFDARDLVNAGFTPAKLLAAGFTRNQINRVLPVDDATIKSAGCDPLELKKLNNLGVTAKKIHDLNGCNINALKQAGFNAKDIMESGFTPSQLLNAGFTQAEIDAAKPIDDKKIKDSGCDPQALKKLLSAGVSAKKIHDLNGCSAEALRNAGFDASDLTMAGFTPEQLQAAGFTKEQIESAKDASNANNAAIRAAGCDPIKLQALFKQGVSAKEIKELNGCSAEPLKLAGFDAKSLNAAGFSPSELESAGFTKADINAAVNANDAAIKAAGCDPQKLNVLNKQGFSAKRIRDLNGCSAEAFRKAGFDASELAKAGFTPEQLQAAGFGNVKLQSDNANISDKEIKDSGCDPIKLKKLFQSGVSAKRIHDLNGCSAEALKNAGFDAKQLANAGFTPSQLLAAGFTADQFKKAGLIPAVVIASGRTSDCNVDSLKSSHALGVSAETIKETLGCSAKQMKDAGYTATELKNAGFTAAELKDSGFSLDDLKNAGFNLKELQSAGFSANDLKNLGFTAAQLKEAGFSASDLKNAGLTLKQLKALGYNATNLKDAGFSAEEMRKEGFNAKELKEAGLNAGQLKNAGYSAQELLNAGFSPNDSSLAGLQEVTKTSTQPTSTVNFASKNGPSSIVAAAESNNKQLQEIVDRQQKQMTEQRHQQKIQQRANAMVSEASKDIQEWKAIPTQIYIAGSAPKENTTAAAGLGKGGINNTNNPQENLSNEKLKALIKAGDIIFAVLDTTVNTDEPSPILATVVDGPFKGAKLIGSFTLPSNADKMVISFNTMSVPGADKTTQINAYAIDANTARTAMSSRANHHYLSRYGALFAATFLEGFGNAFQSANTTISIGGSGGAAAGQNTTIANGVGRSTLENAVIGLATLGKSWGQVAQQNVNRPTTVEVFSGTGIGVLFTQDLKSL